MKKSIIIVLCIVFALIVPQQTVVFLSKRNYKKAISTALSIPVKNLKFENYINVLSVPGEGYTFMRLKVKSGIDTASIPPLPEQEEWQIIPWNYTNKDNPLPEYLAHGIRFVSGYNINKELSALSDIFRTRGLLVGGYCRCMDTGSPGGILYIIDVSENNIYHIDYQY